MRIYLIWETAGEEDEEQGSKDGKIEATSLLGIKHIC